MRILGIDPGLNNIGWGIIDKNGNNIKLVAHGLIKTNSKDKLHDRLAEISFAIEKVILDHLPSFCSIEETFVNMNALSSLKLAHARGCIMAMVARHNIELVEFSPTKIKKTIVGIGRADKEQVIHMVGILLPNAKNLKSDVADALAAAICYSQHL